MLFKKRKSAIEEEYLRILDSLHREKRILMSFPEFRVAYDALKTKMRDDYGLWYIDSLEYFPSWMDACIKMMLKDTEIISVPINEEYELAYAVLDETDARYKGVEIYGCKIIMRKS